MTRAEMLAEVRSNLMQQRGDPSSEFGGPAEEAALDRAADETAQKTDCYFAEQIDTLTANQSEYCYPKIYKVKAVYAVDYTGKRWRLERTTPNSLDRTCSEWRTWTAQDIPRFAAFAGLTRFKVAPVAAATRASGIIVAGFALPSLPKNGHDLHQWDVPDDECPLPAWAHDAVILRATSRRFRQLAARDKSALAMANEYDREWRIACGEVAAQAAKAYRNRQDGNAGECPRGDYYG